MTPVAGESFLDIEGEMMVLLDSVLGLGGRGLKFSAESPLLGALPEFDSMAVASVLAAVEDRWGILIEDDEVDGALFANVGSLIDFVRRKLAG